jgi:hypothetical protein
MALGRLEQSEVDRKKISRVEPSTLPVARY